VCLDVAHYFKQLFQPCVRVRRIVQIVVGTPTLTLHVCPPQMPGTLA
jgi:hypothetical protein